MGNFSPRVVGTASSSRYHSCKEGLPEVAHISGPTTPALLEQTISQKFEEVCRNFPDRTAVKTPKYRLSYQQLHEKSLSLAIGLTKFGLLAGDRVAISLGNCAEYAVIAYACFKIGLIVVPLNPAYTSDQTISALNHISAACFIVSTDISLPYKQAKSTAPLLSAIRNGSEDGPKVSERVPSLRKVVLVNNASARILETVFSSLTRFEELVSSSEKHDLPTFHKLSNNDLATIQFTSGTTSTPKAACLSHRNILNNALLVGSGMLLTERDIICCPPPLYHCFGLVLGLLAAMNYGACVLLPSEAYNARAVLASLDEDRPTALYGVPTMFLAELELLAQGSLKQHNFSHLRTGVIGGSPIPSALRLKLHQQLNLSDLASCYGLTESSPIICMTLPSDTIEQKLDTVGQVLPHTSVKIVARDDPNRTLRRGEKGELLISGYCVMSGYWQDGYWTSITLIEEINSKDGVQEQTTWLRSGDEAMIDEMGYIQITGRIKDIIIRGGENIYPPEIENVLLQHPMVANASVVGLPDYKYGESIAAFVVAKDVESSFAKTIRVARVSKDNGSTEDDIKRWVAERLGKMMVPKYIFWIEQMPLTASGKVEKYKLKEIGTELLTEPNGTRD